MRSLYLRIYLTVVAVLALFALASGWAWRSHMDHERERDRERMASAQGERVAAWADLLQNSLPAADAPREQQAKALLEWSQRLRLPLALDDAQGQRLATAEAFERREADAPGGRRAMPMRLDDGRTLWVMRPGRMFGPQRVGEGPPPRPGTLVPVPEGKGLVMLLVMLFAAVAAGAWPVVRRLTRRLEALKSGVEAFGQGRLSQRVDETGRDEVAALGASFNRAAQRIESLMQAQKSLLANASHELRSPLTRLKMAVSMAEDASPAQRAQLQREIHDNIRELDALVEEVLMFSRLEGTGTLERQTTLDLLALAAEEAARFGVQAGGFAASVLGDERLLRRLLRNLLENAQRYGGDELSVEVSQPASGQVAVAVLDRGPGVPPELRERIFEPFFRMPGHAEREGGVGLGLALVRQIARQHGGTVQCEPRDRGGSAFVATLAAAPRA